MNFSFFSTGVLQVFIALGAIAGGYTLMKDPSGSIIGFPLTWLEGSIFRDFFLPGLFLFAVHGLGSLLGALLSFLKSRFAGRAAIILGAVLVVWILIQLSIIRTVNWMHPVYVVLGLVELALGVVLLRRYSAA